MRNTFQLVGAALISLTSLFAGQANAVDYVWDAGGGANQGWQVTANWNPESPTPNYATDTFLIGNGFTANANTGNVTAALTLEGTLLWSLNNAQANNLILNGGALTSNSGGQTYINNTSGQIQINDADAGPGVTTSYVSNSGAGNFYFYSRLNAGAGGSGNLDLTRNGTGNLILFNSGATGGTWAGNMTISAGKVDLNGRYSLANGTLIVDADELDITGGFSTGTVRVDAGGVANIAGGNLPINALRLNGGTVKGTVTTPFTDTGSNFYVDNDSSISYSGGDRFLIQAKLNGSANLQITGTGRTALAHNTNVNSYSGTITIANGAVLTTENQWGLSGGTVQVNSGGGTFRIGSGFGNGAVYVNSGAVMQWNGQDVPAAALHLNGGTLAGTVNTAYSTTGNTTQFYIDSDSQVRHDAGDALYLRGRLNGTGNLVIQTPTGGGTGLVRLGYNANAATYSGQITIQNGATLEMENAFGLSGGTVELDATSGSFNLRSGIANGVVHAGTGGTIRITADNAVTTGQLRLDGGTLATPANGYIGGSASNVVYVDSASNLNDTLGSQDLYLPTLSGSGKLTSIGAGVVRF